MDNYPELTRIDEVTLLRERAYQVIKEAIVRLKFVPGQELKEVVLSQQLGISKTPIREALLRLEQEGFVKYLPFKGACVREIDRNDVREIFELRVLVEGEAVRRAAQRITEEGIERLRQLVARMEVAAEQGDLQGYSQLSKAFHGVLMEQIDNRRMRAILENLADHEERVRVWVIKAPWVIPGFIEDYRDILKAVQENKPDEASRMMKRHLEKVLQVFLAG